MTDITSTFPTDLPPYDLHNHTFHCGHAADDATVENLVMRAEQLQLAYFGLSEHVIFPEDVERIAQIRKELSSIDLGSLNTNILVGVEIDADPFRLDGSWVADPGPVDFTILSPHRIPEY